MLINSIKFTKTELKVIACFTPGYIKSSWISKILDKPLRTIYSHIGKIKGKINCQTISGIELFVKKSDQFNVLKDLFKAQYIDYSYRETIKRISYKIKALKVVCHVIVSDALKNSPIVNDIIDAIKLANIDIKIIEELQMCDNNFVSNHFCLFIKKKLEPLKNANSAFKENALYVILEKQTNEGWTAQKNNVLFFDLKNKTDFYKFFLNYLIKNYKKHINSNEANKFISEIDNITNNIQPDYFNQQEKIVSNQVQKTQLHKKKSTAVLGILIVTGIFCFTYILTRKIPYKSINTIQLSKTKQNSTLLCCLPPRNKKFTGRDKIFEEIKRNLNHNLNNVGMSIQPVVGIGGIGKSQLLSEYAYRSIENKEYDLVLWVSAENLNTIHQSYNEFADNLKLNIRKLSPPQVIKAVHKIILEKHNSNKILFILDNVVKKSEAKLYLDQVYKQFSLNTKVHVLLTSRSQHWNENPIILDTFTPKEAEIFVRKNLPNENNKDIITLNKTLFYFPLALGQAVGYIKQHTNIKNYLRLYESKKQKYLNEHHFKSNQYKKTLWETLFIATENLNEKEKEILYISAHLNPDNIQLEIFDNLSIEDRDKAVQQLRDHSLITLNKSRKGFKIHRLLQEIIRLSNKKETKWVNKAVQLSHKSIKQFDRENHSTWEKVKIWFPHLETLSNYMKQNLVLADLFHQYGEAAFDLRLYYLSDRYLTNALKIKENFLPNTKHINLVKTLNQLGFIKVHIGCYLKGRNLIKRAFEIQNIHYQDPNHVELAETLRYLGMIERYLCNYGEAKKLLQRALKIKKNSSHLFSFLNSLSLAELSLGNFNEAKKLSQQSLSNGEAYFKNPNHIKLARNIANLGFIEYSLANYEKAKQLLQRSLKIATSYYKDPNHSDLGFISHHLGLAEEALGNYTDALKYLKRSYNILYNHSSQPQVGDLHEMMAHVYTPAIPWLKLTKHNQKTAIQYYQESLKITKKLFGEAHHFVGRYYYLLGQAYELNNENQKSNSAYRKSFKISKKALGMIKDDVVATRHTKNIAILRSKMTIPSRLRFLK